MKTEDRKEIKSLEERSPFIRWAAKNPFWVFFIVFSLFGLMYAGDLYTKQTTCHLNTYSVRAVFSSFLSLTGYDGKMVCANKIAQAINPGLYWRHIVFNSFGFVFLGYLMFISKKASNKSRQHTPSAQDKH